MADYIRISKSEDLKQISIQFDCGQDSVFTLGERMNEACEEAYMNGYNWDAFFNAYLGVYAPELLENLDSDPEGGSYFAYYSLTPENWEKAEKFKQIVVDLVENESRIFEFLESYGDSVEWD